MSVPNIPLNDGRSIPQLGFGVWQVGPDVIVPSLLTAFEAGYRSIDTAAIYENEEGVGEAIRQSGLPREELFVTTKLWSTRHENPTLGLEESLGRLGLDYVDLYLIHWPTPKLGKHVQAYEGLIQLREKGLAKSIGVSNFTISNLQDILDATGVPPTVNQVELHPLFPQGELRAVHEKYGIVTESWSPLARGHLDGSSVLAEIAEKHGKSPAQIILRWNIELGLVVIPRSVNPERIRQNIDLFDFSLDAEDMAKIASLDENRRIGGDPAVANYGV